MDISTGPQGQGVTAALTNWMKSIFGDKFRLSRGYSSSHDGVDLPAPIGTPVYALKAGVVSYARDARNDPNAGSGWAIGGGKVVNIDIGGKLTTQYAHLNTINVKAGQLVSKGQQIGTVGKTGFDIGGSHLHFGLWDKNINKMINPSSFFNSLGDTTPSGGTGVILANSPITIDTLRQLLGGNITLDHRLTKEEATKIQQKWYPNNAGPAGSVVVDALTGKTVREFLAGTIGSISPDNIGNLIPDVGTAIADVGTQIADTVTWIGFIFVGLVFLIVGGLLVSGVGGIGASNSNA